MNQGDLSREETWQGVTASVVARKRRNGRGAKGRREVEDGNGQKKEEELAAVSTATKQARDIRARWNWVEPEVWTDRMLTALEQGVKGGQWFSLMDKVYSAGNLRQAFRAVQANGGSAGVDHETVEMFARQVEANLEKISRALAE